MSKPVNFIWTEDGLWMVQSVLRQVVEHLKKSDDPGCEALRCAVEGTTPPKHLVAAVNELRALVAPEKMMGVYWPSSEEEHERLLELANSVEKNVFAHLLANTTEPGQSDYAAFFLWRKLTSYLLKHGWSAIALRRMSGAIL